MSPRQLGAMRGSWSPDLDSSPRVRRSRGTSILPESRQEQWESPLAELSWFLVFLVSLAQITTLLRDCSETCSRRSGGPRRRAPQGSWLKPISLFRVSGAIDGGDGLTWVAVDTRPPIRLSLCSLYAGCDVRDTFSD